MGFFGKATKQLSILVFGITSISAMPVAFAQTQGPLSECRALFDDETYDFHWDRFLEQAVIADNFHARSLLRRSPVQPTSMPESSDPSLATYNENVDLNHVGPVHLQRYYNAEAIDHIVELPRQGVNAYQAFTERTYDRSTHFVSVYQFDTRLRKYPNQPADADINESRQVTRSRQLAKETLLRILSVVIPSYVHRRGWSLENANSWVSKAFETFANTRYIEIRNKNADGSPGETVAVLGLHKAAYGKFRYFNKVTQAWEEQTGNYGEIWQEETSRALFDNFSRDTVQILGMEKFLGDDFFLERPVQFTDLGKTSSISNYLPASLRAVIDLTKPVYRGSGIIYEPTKFFVAKESDLRRVGYAEILTDLAEFIFPEERSESFNNLGQMLMTYNDARGELLYKLMGFEVMNQYPRRDVGGTSWTVLGLTPQRLAEKLNDQNLMRAKAGDFMRQLSRDLGTHE